MKVLLRTAQGVSDAVLVMAWRSIPDVYNGLYTQHRENRPLGWGEHWKWWASDYRKTWKIFIIQVNDGETTRDVGYLNVAQMDYWEPETGIAVGEIGLWGQGVAKESLKLIFEWLRTQGYKYTRTTIPNHNERAKRLYLSLGYKLIGDARPDEGLYRKEL